MKMLITGHTAECPAGSAHGSRCTGTCEAKLFRITGTLAAFAGAIELIVGFIATSSFAVADAMHAITDAFTDFYGSRTARRVHENPDRSSQIRSHGSRVTAAAMLVAVAFIVSELVFHRGDVIAWAMIIAGGVPLAIHLFRWHLFHQGNRRDPTQTRMDLIRHVRTDTAHSAAVFVTGIAFQITQTQYAEIIDKVLTVGLICYMIWQAWRIGTGHGHDHTHPHTH